MFKKITMLAGSGVLGLVVLFWVANRPISDLSGFVQAIASTALGSIENEIPDAVHDEKTSADLQVDRQQLIDQQVQLNLSQNQMAELESEIEVLTSAISNRKSVLASAYPVLQRALDNEQTGVTFVSAHSSLHDFQNEIDNLLAMQERDEKMLAIKQQGLQQLTGSVKKGELDLSEKKSKLFEREQDFTVLKTRRHQARMEADTLNLSDVATANATGAGSQAGQGIQRLKNQVESLEARNEARREMAPADQRASRGQITKAYNRLEALKKYAEQKSDSEDEDDKLTSKSESNLPIKIAAHDVLGQINESSNLKTDGDE